jgi:RimJ/RimL family protein N-acetyltransferase
MPSDATIRFDPVTPEHYPLLRRWLALPHWREWWGDPETELGYIVDMVEGRDGSHPFIFSVEGEPAGYIQYWHIGPHQTEEWLRDHPWLAELPKETVGVDLSIGEACNLAKGLGTAVLRAFVAKLRAEGHTHIIIDPDPLNARAVRAYTKAGFVPVPHLAGKTEGVLIMHHVSDAKDTLQ